MSDLIEDPELGVVYIVEESDKELEKENTKVTEQKILTVTAEE